MPLGHPLSYWCCHTYRCNTEGLTFGSPRWSTFSATTNSASCTDHHTCDPGEFVAVQATTSSDRVCSQCHEGVTFSSGANANTCTPLTLCDLGTLVIAEPELYSDRECEACPSTTFSASFNLADCSAWKDCSAGEFVSVFPTSANDRVCSFTRVGFEYTANENQETPLPVTKCGAGTMCAQF